MYPDAYEVGAAQPGRPDPVRGAQRARGRARRAHLRRLAGPRGADAGARDAPVHRGLAPPGRRPSMSSASASPPNSATPTCSPRWTSRASPCDAADRDRRRTPSCVAGGHAAFNPEPIAEFIDAAVLGDGEQAVLADHRARRGRGRPTGARGAGGSCCCGWPGPVVSTSRRSTTSTTTPTAAIAAVAPNRPGVPWRVSKHTLMDLDEWPYPKAPLVPLAETVHERMSVEIFRGCTRGCRFCQAGHDHPAGPRAQRRPGSPRWSTTASSAPASRRSACCRLSSADHSEIGEMAKGLADRYEGTQTSAVPAEHARGRLQHRPGQRTVPQRPSLRADVRAGGRQRAAAQGHQQDGHRGGPDPHRDRRPTPTAGGR